MNSIDDDITALAAALVEAARTKGLKLATAESCTGGLVGGAITRIAGSSDAFDRGFITYSDAAKMAHLNVSEDTLNAVGAVSEAVAREMAVGALAASGCDMAVSITGIAGPGGSDHKPAGLVWFGLAMADGQVLTRERHYGDIGRDAVRQASVREALDFLLFGVDRP
ncbi:CinA family protein [Hyphobacterium sp.]|jgi:nicotinamide-nucleotide amidase|uniref:CinA family protein n=1 Tax=Hyphobacterium sp. TaxID=2004662 RepID=UPI003BA9E573